jgi:hypothetical protein
MPKLYITEFVTRGIDPKGPNEFPEYPPNATQVLDTAGTSVSASFQPTTNILRLAADGVVSFAVGLAPVATTSDSRMPANTVEYIDVPANQGYKISIIPNT